MRKFNDFEILHAFIIREEDGGTLSKALEKIAGREITNAEMELLYDRISTLRLVIRDHYGEDEIKNT